MLIVDRQSAVALRFRPRGFNLILEMLIVDRQNNGGLYAYPAKVSISHLRCLSLIGRFSDGSRLVRNRFNLTLEMLIVDRAHEHRAITQADIVSISHLRCLSLIENADVTTDAESQLVSISHLRCLSLIAAEIIIRIKHHAKFQSHT